MASRPSHAAEDRRPGNPRPAGPPPKFSLREQNLNAAVQVTSTLAGMLIGSLISDLGTAIGTAVGTAVGGSYVSGAAKCAYGHAIQKLEGRHARVPAPQRLNVQRVKVSAIGAAAVCVLVLGVLTVAEQASGTPLHAALTGQHETGTTLGGARTASPAPSSPAPAVTPSAVSSPTVTPSSVPVTTTPATTGPSAVIMPTSAGSAPVPAPSTVPASGLPAAPIPTPVQIPQGAAS